MDLSEVADFVQEDGWFRDLMTIFVQFLVAAVNTSTNLRRIWVRRGPCGTSRTNGTADGFTFRTSTENVDRNFKFPRRTRRWPLQISLPKVRGAVAVE